VLHTERESAMRSLRLSDRPKW